MTESEADEMAASNPTALLDAIEYPTMSDMDLTFAAEIAGRINDPRAKFVLMHLLDHKNSVVREGAIYGLASHLDDDVRAKLALLADADPSYAIREAAREMLLP